MSSRDWFGRGGSGDGPGAGGPGRPGRSGARAARPTGPPVAQAASAAGRAWPGAVRSCRPSRSSSRSSCSSRSWRSSGPRCCGSTASGSSTVFRVEVITKVAAVRRRRPARRRRSSASSLVIAYRTRPIYPPVVRGAAGPGPLPRDARAAAPASPRSSRPPCSACSPARPRPASGRLLLWRNGEPFGKKDPQFGMDIGFFVFTLPWLRFVLGFLIDASSCSPLIAAASPTTCTAACGCRPAASAPRPAARVHLSVLLAALVLRPGRQLLAGPLLADHRGLAGADHRPDLHRRNAVLPAKAILAVTALIVRGAVLRDHLDRAPGGCPLIGVGLLRRRARSSSAASTRRSSSSFQVKPSEQTLEAPYIKRNINATRAAYGLDDVDATAVQRRAPPPPRGQLRNDADTIPGIRLLDPDVVSADVPAAAAGPAVLPVPRRPRRRPLHDRRQAARHRHRRPRARPRRPAAPTSATGSTTTRSTPTATASSPPTATSAATDGKPVFSEQNIPPTGALGDRSSRGSTSASTRRTTPSSAAPRAAAPTELDYPDSSAGGQQNTTYTGNGGVAIGSFASKAAYAIKYRELNILLSDAVNADSQILYDRTPRERVEKVAPWLTLDGNAYPAVVDGRVKWIVDGYTTTGRLPVLARCSSIGERRPTR